MVKSSLSILVFIGLLIACSKEEQSASLIITGRIYTMDDKQPVVEAVAVQGERIIFAGSKEESRKYKGDSTQVIDLGEKIMTPGFIEGHAHILGVGYNEMNLDLMNVQSYDEIAARVKQAVAKTSPGQWILGRGWHQDKWTTKPQKLVKGFQTHQLLSEASPDNPVFLYHASGHTAMANAKAMQLAGVNTLSRENKSKVADGDGGEVLRDELGNPTGIFSENAMSLIEKQIPENNEDSDSTALELAMDACLRNGITSFHDAGEGGSAIRVFYKFKKEQKLKIRLYVMLENNHNLLRYWYAKGPDIDSLNRLTIRSIKLYSDGALGSRGAWLLQPYTDRPDFSGFALIPMDSILKVSREGLQYGFQVCTHAIGDRANREVLNQYETALKENPEKAATHRFRVEHAQHIDPQDLPRFAQLGVIPAMQAIHMSSDRPWAIERLGEKRIVEGAYMWQSLLKSGAKIVNGTDSPVEPLNPIACFYASVTRKTLKGTPEGGYEPAEKMTREQALRSYTLHAAYGAFEEEIKGSLERGKLADFTILSQDIMTIPEALILNTQIEMTIVGGKILYSKK
jgi:predicted amidohydrolase YtcJ